LSDVRSFDIAVLGGGPAGLVAALEAARVGRTVLITDRMAIHGNRVRIDCVSARTLALLTELGVDPRALGVAQLGSGRWSSWSSVTPAWHSDAATAHIERPLLESSLFAAVCAKSVTIIIDRQRPHCGELFEGPGWRAKYLIDASGRAAVTASERRRPASPWASRFYWTHRTGITVDPTFRIAPFPGGYVYRLGSDDKIGIGIVGENTLLKLSASGLERHLKEMDSEWILYGMPQLDFLHQGARGVATVQWTLGTRAVAIGDAALAHDALSSHGLGVSLSDALYAVAAIGAGQLDALQARYTANRTTHLQHLKTSLAHCRFGDRPAWKRYEDFVASNASDDLEKVDQPQLVNRPLVRSGLAEIINH